MDVPEGGPSNGNAHIKWVVGVLCAVILATQGGAAFLSGTRDAAIEKRLEGLEEDVKKIPDLNSEISNLRTQVRSICVASSVDPDSCELILK